MEEVYRYTEEEKEAEESNEKWEQRGENGVRKK